jgi:hypothetical protein
MMKGECLNLHKAIPFTEIGLGMITTQKTCSMSSRIVLIVSIYYCCRLLHIWAAALCKIEIDFGCDTSHYDVTALADQTNHLGTRIVMGLDSQFG